MPLRRFGSVVKVKPNHWEAYKRLHEEAWPDLLRLFGTYHVSNFSIYHLDGYLFSYKEYTGTDFESDMAKLAEEPLMKNWWALTGPCQEPMKSCARGQLWTDMEEIFHMD